LQVRYETKPWTTTPCREHDHQARLIAAIGHSRSRGVVPSRSAESKAGVRGWGLI
jgi:hypothetical protein